MGRPAPTRPLAGAVAPRLLLLTASLGERSCETSFVTPTGGAPRGYRSPSRPASARARHVSRPPHSRDPRAPHPVHAASPPPAMRLEMPPFLRSTQPRSPNATRGSSGTWATAWPDRGSGSRSSAAAVSVPAPTRPLRRRFGPCVQIAAIRGAPAPAPTRNAGDRVAAPTFPRRPIPRARATRTLSPTGPPEIRPRPALARPAVSMASWGVAELPQIVANYKNGASEAMSYGFILSWIFGDILNGEDNPIPAPPPPGPPAAPGPAGRPRAALSNPRSPRTPPSPRYIPPPRRPQCGGAFSSGPPPLSASSPCSTSE